MDINRDVHTWLEESEHSSAAGGSSAAGAHTIDAVSMLLVIHVSAAHFCHRRQLRLHPLATSNLLHATVPQP